MIDGKLTKMSEFQREAFFKKIYRRIWKEAKQCVFISKEKERNNH